MFGVILPFEPPIDLGSGEVGDVFPITVQGEVVAKTPCRHYDLKVSRKDALEIADATVGSWERGDDAPDVIGFAIAPEVEYRLGRTVEVGDRVKFTCWNHRDSLQLYTATSFEFLDSGDPQ
ncbi:MAG: hypothetical protein E7001_04345 [Coriobacteriaceae bacterium]|nr:hypothetical protein [Coriobacteriaceae bacterium]